MAATSAVVAVFLHSLVSRARLQFFRAVDLVQIAVECAERQMTGLSGDFEKEAIGEAKRWSRPEDLECCCHHFAVLEDQTEGLVLLLRQIPAGTLLAPIFHPDPSVLGPAMPARSRRSASITLAGRKSSMNDATVHSPARTRRSASSEMDNLFIRYDLSALIDDGVAPLLDVAMTCPMCGEVSSRLLDELHGFGARPDPWCPGCGARRPLEPAASGVTVINAHDRGPSIQSCNGPAHLLPHPLSGTPPTIPTENLAGWVRLRLQRKSEGQSATRCARPYDRSCGHGAGATKIRETDA
jgi:hypothetical protein